MSLLNLIIASESAEKCSLSKTKDVYYETPFGGGFLKMLSGKSILSARQIHAGLFKL